MASGSSGVVESHWVVVLIDEVIYESSVSELTLMVESGGILVTAGRLHGCVFSFIVSGFMKMIL